MRVLMVGCAAGTGDLGACDEKEEAWVANALRASFRTYARRNKASLVVLKDFPAKYREALGSLYVKWLCAYAQHANDAACSPSFPRLG